MNQGIVMLGGKNCRFLRVKGDIVVSYQYVNDEPAMVLFPKGRSGPGIGALIVCLSAAYKYANNDGYPTLYLIEQAARAAEQMGMGTHYYTIHRIADVILDGLEDLVRMQPEPEDVKEKRAPMGEIVIKQGGRTVMEGEV